VPVQYAGAIGAHTHKPRGPQQVAFALHGVHNIGYISAAVLEWVIGWPIPHVANSEPHIGNFSLPQARGLVRLPGVGTIIIR